MLGRTGRTWTDGTDVDGRDGRDGWDGRDGRDGRDGIERWLSRRRFGVLELRRPQSHWNPGSDDSAPGFSPHRGDLRGVKITTVWRKPGRRVIGTCVPLTLRPAKLQSSNSAARLPPLYSIRPFRPRPVPSVLVRPVRPRPSRPSTSVHVRPSRPSTEKVKKYGRHEPR